MNKSTNKYYFSTNNLNIAAHISKNQFDKYSKFILKIRPLEPIITTYKIMKSQYSWLLFTPKIIENLPLLSESETDISVSAITIYIIINRMLFDHCKNFKNNNKDLNLDETIEEFDNLPCERNLHLLRNYAEHTSLPITGLNIDSFASKSVSKTTIIPIISKNKMVKGFNPNKHDTETINNWKNGRIQIFDEIKKANIVTEQLIQAIIKRLINTRIGSDYINLIKHDKLLWTKILIPYRTRGVFNNQNTCFYTDSQLLKMTVSSILRIHYK